jgi:hypothetical protein
MDKFWELFAQRLLLEAIPILIPLVIAVIGKWAVELWQNFKNSKPDFAWAIEKAAFTSVHAAEQVGLLGELGNEGKYKLDYAIDFAQKWLAKQGIKNVDLTLLRGAIEAELHKAQFPPKAG